MKKTRGRKSRVRVPLRKDEHSEMMMCGEVPKYRREGLIKDKMLGNDGIIKKQG
jgi:hypothetical protein